MRDQILKEISRIAATNAGVPPGRERFERETGIGKASWLGVYWARWGDALVEAGFSPNAKQTRLDNGFVLRKVAEACRHYGRLPKHAEFRLYKRLDPKFPSHDFVQKHFGGTEKMVQHLAEWIKTDATFSDLAPMLPCPPATPETTSARPSEGHVYLLKSGAFYKIGRSDELERRVKEIKVALPDAATLVHTIRTDDPPGIEAYWHRRFADRRANGEWFKLSSADVAAFKRRKFQ